MSDTPRTDAFLNDPEYLGMWGSTEAIVQHFARQLERDAAMFKELYHRQQQEKCEAQDKCSELAAEIDRLMLEFCPDEMSKEQIREWARHQRPVKWSQTRNRLKENIERVCGGCKQRVGEWP